jgi:hypothetical protein
MNDAEMDAEIEDFLEGFNRVQISGAAAVQLDLFFAASHSMEPGRMRFGQLAASPHPAPTPADS